MFICDLIKDWSNCAARATPLSPEINKNWLAALEYDLIEIGCGYFSCAHLWLLFNRF
jgi:hypothetical protein